MLLATHVLHLVANLLPGNQLINDPLQALATLNHVHHKHSLIVSVLLQDVVLDLDFAGAGADDQGVVGGLLLDGEFLAAEEVLVALDVHDRELDVEGLSVELDFLVCFVALARLEVNGCVPEEIVALSVDLELRDAESFKLDVQGILVLG